MIVPPTQIPTFMLDFCSPFLPTLHTFLYSYLFPALYFYSLMLFLLLICSCLYYTPSYLIGEILSFVAYILNCPYLCARLIVIAPIFLVRLSLLYTQTLTSLFISLVNSCLNHLAQTMPHPWYLWPCITLLILAALCSLFLAQCLFSLCEISIRLLSLSIALFYDPDEFP